MMCRNLNSHYRASFRCGLFFPPEVEGELPIAPLFIFNASYPAEECKSGNDNSRFISFCTALVSCCLPKRTFSILIASSYQWNKIVSYIVYKGPSYNNKNEKNTDVTMGDEICA